MALPKVFFHERQHHFGEELDVLGGGLVGGASRVVAGGLEKLHVDGGAVQVLDELLEQTVGETALQGRIRA